MLEKITWGNFGSLTTIIFIKMTAAVLLFNLLIKSKMEFLNYDFSIEKKII